MVAAIKRIFKEERNFLRNCNKVGVAFVGRFILLQTSMNYLILFDFLLILFLLYALCFGDKQLSRKCNVMFIILESGSQLNN